MQPYWITGDARTYTTPWKAMHSKQVLSTWLRGYLGVIYSARILICWKKQKTNYMQTHHHFLFTNSMKTSQNIYIFPQNCIQAGGVNIRSMQNKKEATWFKRQHTSFISNSFCSILICGKMVSSGNISSVCLKGENFVRLKCNHSP